MNYVIFKRAQGVLIAVGLLVGAASMAGLFEASIINIVSTWFMGYPVLVSALDTGSALLGFEQGLFDLINGFSWSVAIMIAGLIPLFFVPLDPPQDNISNVNKDFTDEQ